MGSNTYKLNRVNFQKIDPGPENIKINTRVRGSQEVP